MDAHNSLYSDGMMLKIKEQLQLAAPIAGQFHSPIKDAQYMHNIQSGIPRSVFVSKFSQLATECSLRIDTPDCIRRAFVGMICICIKYKNRRGLFENIDLSGYYVDWEMGLAKTTKGCAEVNPVGDINMWIHLLDTLKFEHNAADLSKSIYGGGIQAFMCLCNTLRECGLTDFNPHVYRAEQQSDMLSYEHICKTFIILNVLNLPRKQCLNMYLTHIIKRQLISECNSILESLVDSHFDESVYIDDLAHILRTMTVKTDTFITQLNICRAEKMRVYDVLESITKMKTLKHRPSIRDVANLLKISENSRNNVNERRFDVHSIERFCTFIQFPNNLSVKIKQLCYLIVYHPCMDPGDYIAKITSDDVKDKICAYFKGIPEVVSVHLCINNLEWSFQPTDAMIKFKEAVFSALPHTFMLALSWSVLLRLYVTVYLGNPIWKDIWLLIIPILSSQLHRVVCEFVENNAWDAATADMAILNI
jgi:hypothetical protein